MGTVLTRLRQGLVQAVLVLWRGLRSWSGDAAYDRYLQAQAKHGAGGTVLSRQQFYLEQLEKRYSRLSRCC